MNKSNEWDDVKTELLKNPETKIAYDRLTAIDDILNPHAQEFKAGHLDKVRDEIDELIRQEVVDVLGRLESKSEAVKETRILNGDEYYAVTLSAITAEKTRYESKEE